MTHVCTQNYIYRLNYTNGGSINKLDIRLRQMYFHETPLIRYLMTTGLIWGQTWPIMLLSTSAWSTIRFPFPVSSMPSSSLSSLYRMQLNLIRVQHPFQLVLSRSKLDNGIPFGASLGLGHDITVLIRLETYLLAEY